jgi:hypothetical protein
LIEVRTGKVAWTAEQEAEGSIYDDFTELTEETSEEIVEQLKSEGLL